MRKLIVGFMLFFIFAPPCQARKACEWKSGDWYLECDANWLSTGCIGLKNVTERKYGNNKTVRFRVDGGDDHNMKRKLGPGKYESADFNGFMNVKSCQVKINGKWKDIKCWDAFDRKRNNKSGGGCGCKYFKCLPGW